MNILFSDFTKLVIEVMDHKYSLIVFIAVYIIIHCVNKSAIYIIINHHSLFFYFCQCQHF